MAQKQKTNELVEILSPFASRIEADLEKFLVEPGTSSELAEAMRYCVLDGGKRLRPTLVHLGGEAAGKVENEELLGRCSVSVELIHCYSLVHDDLPAMDDDQLRRGKPAAHVKFGEAMAILVGDALLTRAFGVLAESNDALTGRVSHQLAQAAGAVGMIGGQVADMDLCKIPAGAEGINVIHSLKTAALIRCSVKMGAICGRADDNQLEAMSNYGLSLGLAFQLADDLLDVSSSAEILGKTPGKDDKTDKRTFVNEIGIEQSRELLDKITLQATEALKPLGEKAQKLQRLAEVLAMRIH